MHSNKYLSLLAFTGIAFAQRPDNTSICDYYTTALLKENNVTNQYTVLTLVVNTVVIGNYTMPNVGIAVPGILAKGEYNGTQVDLLPYFDGGLASTNEGGMSGMARNFLDDGGAAPLMLNMPANGQDSNQYKLLTRLYTYFGVLLGCSMLGQDGTSTYMGSGSQYSVHKFMALDAYQVGYFINQVGLAAASFGVTPSDVVAIETALSDTFGQRCAPPTTVLASQGAQLQAVCTEDNCPMAADHANCSAYDTAVMEPAVANSSLADGQGVNATSISTTTAADSMMTQSGTMMATATAKSSSSSMDDHSHSTTATTTGGNTATSSGMAVQLTAAAALVGAVAMALAL